MDIGKIKQYIWSRMNLIKRLNKIKSVYGDYVVLWNQHFVIHNFIFNQGIHNFGV